MDKHLLILGIALWTHPGWAAVTVDFTNFGLDANNAFWNAPILDESAMPLGGPPPAISVELLYDQTPFGGSGFVAVSPTTDIVGAGLFGGGTLTIPEDADPGTEISLIVRVWDTTTGGSFDLATRRGSSDPFPIIVPTPPAPQLPAFPASMEGMSSFAVVPELAETGALLGIFALSAGLFLRRHRACRSCHFCKGD